MIKKEILFEYLDELYPDAHCELNYTKDYELLIAIMLSAQTTDKSVNRATAVLFSRYNSLEELKNADIKDIENIIKFLGFFENKAKYVKEIARILVDDFGGVVPNDPKELIKLPGCGNKTVNCYLANMFNEPLWAVDTHVQRVTKRLGISEVKDSPIAIEKKLIKYVPTERTVKTNHQIIWFGRYFCRAITPNCDNCKLREFCKGKSNY